jgi:hypothetical protein
MTSNVQNRTPALRRPPFGRLRALLPLLLFILSAARAGDGEPKKRWRPLFNGRDLEGWTIRGDAAWRVQDGVIVGEGARGHLYAAPVLADLEVRGEFRITDLGKGANAGLYFRAQEPSPNPNGFPVGYEAQICHNQEAHTGWLWRPGKPTGRATALLTKDGEWFPMRVRAEGSLIRIWVKDSLVMTWSDTTYREGRFALQCHNPGMRFEARALQYRPLH